jgi:CRISPR-associated protein (TIGR03984 family)
MLELQKAKVKLEKGSINDNILSFIQEKMNSNGIFVAWQINKIIWGKFENNKFITPAEFELSESLIKDIRVFNQDKEIFISKKYNSYGYRIFEDNNSDNEMEYVVSKARLWGQQTKKYENGFVELLDQKRKIKMVIPVDIDSDYYELKTFNYIDYDELTKQAGYVDNRFVAITVAGGVD